MSGETVEINGEKRPLAGLPVADALRETGIDPDSGGVAVAVNDRVVPRGQWRARVLEPGDRVEVVGAVQGG